MTLSQAIRLGARLKPQTMGMWQAGGKTCAAGAALDAIGRLETDEPSLLLQEQWPVSTLRVQHPACPHITDYSVLAIITTLNDCEGWSRERIADWVESIEAQQPPPARVSDCYDYATGVTEPAPQAHLAWMDVERLR
jgi:hypothetical protein